MLQLQRNTQSRLELLGRQGLAPVVLELALVEMALIQHFLPSLQLVVVVVAQALWMVKMAVLAAGLEVQPLVKATRRQPHHHKVQTEVKEVLMRRVMEQAEAAERRQWVVMEQALQAEAVALVLPRLFQALL